MTDKNNILQTAKEKMKKAEDAFSHELGVYSCRES